MTQSEWDTKGWSDDTPYISATDPRLVEALEALRVCLSTIDDPDFPFAPVNFLERKKNDTP